jgi:Response regulators consisting of a CheY-like receiver domain and a winged-helix DNA-binding domain
MQNRVLIVDDEEDILNLLRDYFEINGYTVMIARNGAEALRQAERSPDIILLDINMPDLDGLEVCKKLRNHISCPILFLTARVSDADKIRGFGAGGDDYIVKPFSIEELGARVSAHIRREERNQKKTRIRFMDELVVDYSERTVFFKDTLVALAKKEFDIIELLSINKGQIFDKERIYEKLWGWDSEGDSSVVAEHIRRIRSKLVSACGRSYIETVWGVGYKWVG